MPELPSSGTTGNCFSTNDFAFSLCCLSSAVPSWALQHQLDWRQLVWSCIHGNWPHGLTVVQQIAAEAAASPLYLVSQSLGGPRSSMEFG